MQDDSAQKVLYNYDGYLSHFYRCFKIQVRKNNPI